MKLCSDSGSEDTDLESEVTELGVDAVDPSGRGTFVPFAWWRVGESFISMSLRDTHVGDVDECDDLRRFDERSFDSGVVVRIFVR